MAAGRGALRFVRRQNVPDNGLHPEQLEESKIKKKKTKQAGAK